MTFYQPDKKRFKQAFWKGKEWFKQYGDTIAIPNRPDDLLVYQDNGKKVLVVCHTDYVTPFMPLPDAQAMYSLFQGKVGNKSNLLIPPRLTHKQLGKLERRWVINEAKRLNGPVVDDRLGCAIALGLSDWADVLLTDCEEVGKSTAGEFQPAKEYNWIVGLDRRGTDVVTYQYKDKKWLDALGKHFTIGHGSFSDIGYLEGLGRSAVNVGIGYHNEHTRRAFWNNKETNDQLSRLWRFYEEFKDTVFEHKPAKKAEHLWRGSSYYGNHQYGEASHLNIHDNHYNSPNTSWIGGVKNFFNTKTRKWEPTQKALPEVKERDFWGKESEEWSTHLDWLMKEYPHLYTALLQEEMEAEWPQE